MTQNEPQIGGEVSLYVAPDGGVRLDVRLEHDTVWLTQAQMAELFGRERSVITKHINNVFKEGELDRDSVCANFARTAEDGKTYSVQHFNLDVVISVGYRVKSLRGTQFRIWATQATIRKFRNVRAANALLTSRDGGKRDRAMNPNRAIRIFRIAHAAAPTCRQNLQVPSAANAPTPKSNQGFTA